MHIISSFMVAMGLSMDNFAVTIASGCAHHNKIPAVYIAKVSTLFALAHFIMFSGGWFCGEGVERYIGAIDHWVAFFILAFIGIKMIKESREPKTEDVSKIHSFKTLLALSIATSVDALLVGMGLAFTEASFWPTVVMLTVCVFVTSSVGFYLGAFLGRQFGNAVEGLGGAVLIGIGLKLLLEGLGIC